MKILAVDYGDSRTGLATCDRTEFLTTAITPQITLKARNKVAARVCEVAKEIGAELIVIGLPLNMDGTEGERAIKSRKLAKTVEIWSGLPVRMWDERQTTCAAADILDESGTFGTKRKEILDSVSATVILDDYLAWRKEHPGEVFLIEGGSGEKENFAALPRAPSLRELSPQATEGVIKKAPAVLNAAGAFWFTDRSRCSRC